MHQPAVLPCIAIVKAVFTNGTMDGDTPGSSYGEPRLMSMVQNRGFVETKSWMFSQLLIDDPGSRIWLELADGSVNGLDSKSHSLVDAEMRELPGLELRDAGTRLNWIPIDSDAVEAVEPLPGQSAEGCISFATRAK